MDTAIKGQTPERADEALEILADYIDGFTPADENTFKTATACLTDSLGCAVLALNFPACTKLLGPIVPGIRLNKGVRVPGTRFILDPVTAAFNIGTLVRWLDYNDTWLGAEWGHPSDNLGGILALADYLNRNGAQITVRDVLTYMIKAHEVQGILALENSFNRIGLDHVILVKAATAAIATKMLGGTKQQVIYALSQSLIDMGPLRTYRQAPNTGSRKSWAAGDATARGLYLALLTMRGEIGYPKALSAKTWGLYDVLFDGKPFVFQRPLGTYVMDNILFKISFPAEFHAQTAVECAFLLHPKIRERLDSIEKISLMTHESAIRIIDKKGPLHNAADRDHCIQYTIAIGLLHGNLTAKHYEDESAQDPRIDKLREKIVVAENPQYSRDYLDPKKRSISNALTIYFKDGTQIGPIEVEYPLGHKRRRDEGLPLLFKKFEHNLRSQFKSKKTIQLVHLFQDHETLWKMPIQTFMDLLTTK